MPVHSSKQSAETIRALLTDAAYDVLGQHSEEMSQWAPPPEFNAPDGFMRSFVPGTGVGNREGKHIEFLVSEIWNCFFVVDFLYLGNNYLNF